MCKFYTELNEILGQRPATSPVKLVVSMGRKRCSQPQEDGSDNDSAEETQKDEDSNTDDEGMSCYKYQCNIYLQLWYQWDGNVLLEYI